MLYYILLTLMEILLIMKKYKIKGDPASENQKVSSNSEKKLILS